MILNPLFWPLLAAIIILTWLAWRACQEREMPAARPFTMLMVIGALSALFYAIEISLKSPDLKILCSQIRLAIQPFFVPAVTLLVIEYLGWVTWLTRQRMALLFVIPVMTALLSLSGSFHELFRYNFRVDSSGLVSVLFFERGPWWWVYYIYSMLLLIVSCTILFASFRMRSLRYRNTLILAFGILLIVLADILFVLKLTPIAGYYWTPTIFVIPGGLFAWIILRGGLFKTSTVAREVVLEQMQDLALVLDPRESPYRL